MRYIVLAVSACWFLRESRNFHTDGRWQGIIALQACGRPTRRCTGRVSSRTSPTSEAFHIWIKKSGVKRRVAPTGVPINVFSK